MKDIRQSLCNLGAAIRRHPIRAALALPLLFVLYLLALIPLTPGIGDIRKAKAATPTTIVSSDGVVLAEFKRVNREWVPLDKIAPNVINALIATEDRRFFEHHGIDFRRTAGALVATAKGDRQGGSTITQQLARNLYPEEIGRAVNFHRKFKEAITAFKIEALYTKQEILETYLNTVPFLFNAHGIEMAARTYFSKSAAELNVLEAATLIGMLKGTSSFNPVLNPDRALKRRNLVLTQMVTYGKLKESEVARLSARPLKLDFEKQNEAAGPAPHIVQHIRKWMLDWAESNDYDLYSEGLVVRTTLDSRLQLAANKAVDSHMKRLQPAGGGSRKRGEPASMLQAGFMAMDPRDGAVRAWVGSRDFETEQFDHVYQARRQPGSAFKPFVYGAALAMGLPADLSFMDQPVSIRIPGGGVWQPGDVSPPSYAPMTLREGLVKSKNTITAQLMERVGPERVARLAHSLGVRSSKLEPNLALALGTSPVTLREMVAAYGALANGGEMTEPMVLTRIEDGRGRVLAEFQAKRESVDGMSRRQALELVDIMRGVVDRGTGAAIRSRYGITADVAGKTGTTQENTDAWFIMMHPHLVVGARVGYNEKRTMGDWGTGARAALPMVGEVFQVALRHKIVDEKAEFPVERVTPRAPETIEPVDPNLEPPPDFGATLGPDMMLPGSVPVAAQVEPPPPGPAPIRSQFETREFSPTPVTPVTRATTLPAPPPATTPVMTAPPTPRPAEIQPATLPPSASQPQPPREPQVPTITPAAAPPAPKPIAVQITPSTPPPPSPKPATSQPPIASSPPPPLPAPQPAVVTQPRPAISETPTPQPMRSETPTPLPAPLSSGGGPRPVP